jgi:hypothetical protein
MWARTAAGVPGSAGALVVSRTRGTITSRIPQLLPLTTRGPNILSGVPVTRFYHRSTLSPLAKARGGGGTGASQHDDNKANKRSRRTRKKDKMKEKKKEVQLEAEMKEWGLLEGEHKYTPGSTVRKQKEQQGSDPHRQQQDPQNPSSKKSKARAIIPSLLFASHGQMLPPEIQSAMQADPTYFHGRHGVAARWTPPSSNNSKSGGSSSLAAVLQQIQRDQQLKNCRENQDDE